MTLPCSILSIRLNDIPGEVAGTNEQSITSDMPDYGPECRMHTIRVPIYLMLVEVLSNGLIRWSSARTICSAE